MYILYERVFIFRNELRTQLEIDRISSCNKFNATTLHASWKSFFVVVVFNNINPLETRIVFNYFNTWKQLLF